MDAVKNFAYSVVATAPSPATSGTSLVVTAGEGARFPAVPFDLQIWPAGAQPGWAAGSAAGGNVEVVRVTARSTDTLTITRAQYGTTARTVVVGDQVAQVWSKELVDQVAPIPSAIYPSFMSSYLFPESTANANLGSTNGASTCPIQIIVPMMITKIIANLVSASGNIDFGVYLPDGTAGRPLTRVVASGSTACPAAGRRALTVASTLLLPGNYWILLASDNTTVQFGYANHLLAYEGFGFHGRYPYTSCFPLPATLTGSPTQQGDAYYVARVG